MDMPVVDPRFSDVYDHADWEAFLESYHELMREVRADEEVNDSSCIGGRRIGGRPEGMTMLDPSLSPTIYTYRPFVGSSSDQATPRRRQSRRDWGGKGDRELEAVEFY